MTVASKEYSRLVSVDRSNVKIKEKIKVKVSVEENCTTVFDKY